MTPDERALLTNFLRDLGAPRVVPKDPEADQMITKALQTNPDAAYLLVQHAIVADQSLHAAQQRITELEDEMREPAPCPAQSTSFLPQGSGAWGGGSETGYVPPPPEERPGIFSSNSGLGSFLRSAATTAAGVAGGQALFGGLSDIFGGKSDRW